jgi:rubrerythrin
MGGTTMKKTDGKLYARLVCALAVGAFVCCARASLAAEAKPATPAKAPTTLENLMKTFDGESNAHARYLAFAKKADEEGYGQVASLFRAAAASEEVHFKAQAEVIKKMGGTPKADVKAPDVKSTKENLEAAVKGESYERDTMYPEFIKVAEKEKTDAALEVFNEAKAAETAHAKLYQEALGNLDSWKAGKKDFFVCPECGNTVIALTFEKCPVCATPKDKFMKVS